MNERVYDPLTAQFFSPDPALNGRDWLSYNRYVYCMGNPFKYSDPSGNNPLLIAAAIGGFINVGIQLLSGNIHNVGQFYGAFAVGALAGLTGSWIGGLASTALGTATTLGTAIGNGALIGAGSGFAGGFIGGAGNAWMNGASFGDGLIAGIEGAGIGALAGGLIGGISGGLNYSKEISLFTQGNKDMGINSGDPVPATDDFLTQSQEKWYPDAPMDKINDFTVEDVPASTQANMDASQAYAKTNPEVTSINNGPKTLTGRSSVFFNKNLAFKDAKTLFFAMGHEFVHVSQIAYLGSGNFLYSDFKGNQLLHSMMEYNAYSYEFDLKRSLNVDFMNAGSYNTSQMLTTYPDLYNTFSSYYNYNWVKTVNFK